jgi:kinesin family protein 6/9
MCVSNEAVVNINQDPLVLLKKYEREIRDLKHELNQTYVPEAPEKLFDLAKQYLTGSLEEIDDLPSIRYCRDLQSQMRLVYRKLEMNARVGSSRHGDRAGNGGEGTKEQELDPAALKRRKTLIEEEGVGEEEQDGQGFGVGKAPKESKPQSKLEMMEDGNHQNDDEESKVGTEGEGGSEAGLPSHKNKKNKKRQIKGKQDAFKEFKVEDGKQLEDDIKNNRFDLREKKGDMNKLKEVCNRSKKEIDGLKTKLEEKNQERQQDLELDGEEEVIDEEEYSILKQLKEHKKVYRENFDKYKSLKSDAFFVQSSLDKLKEDLIFQFECWYEEHFEPPHGSKEAMKPLDHDFSEQ